MPSSEQMKESRERVAFVPPTARTVKDDRLSSDDQTFLRGLYLRRRRYLLCIFAFSFLVLYTPRLARMQAYLKVTHKIDSLLPEAGFTTMLDNSLQSIEMQFKSAVQQTFLSANQALSPVNSLLVGINCDQKKLAMYASKRLQSQIEPDVEFERLCQVPLLTAYQKQKKILRQLQLDQLGISPEGKVRLMPADSILLAGDSLMQGPASLLVSSMKDKGLVPINRSQISTGLAYPDFFDWPSKIIHSIDRENVKLVVVFLGANDTFDMYSNGKTLQVGSPEWLALYRSRVEKIAFHARVKQVPLIWMGLPAMNRTDIQPYVGALNQIYKSVVESQDGIYIESSFVLGGSQDRFNSVMMRNGKTVKVRSDDGVHFTPAGWSILADTILNKIKI